MAEAKPKTSPKAIKFLFGGLAGYVLLLLAASCHANMLMSGVRQLRGELTARSLILLQRSVK